MLQFYSGSSKHVDSKKAINESLKKALGEHTTYDCDLLILYLTIGHNFKELLSEAHRLVPGARIVGCTGSGIIGTEGPNESMKAVAIMAIKGDDSEFAICGFPSSDCENSYDIGVKLATQLKNQNPGIKFILLHPSLISAQPLYGIIQGIESVFKKNIPLIGAAAIDNMKFISDFEFIDDKVLEKGNVAIGFSDPTLELVCVANHGVEIVGEPMIVTKSEGNLICEIDGKLPWLAYSEKLGFEGGANTSDVLFSPLAIKTKEILREKYNNDYHIPGVFPVPEGKIVANAPLKEGALMWITKRNEDKMFQGVDFMMEQAVKEINGREIMAVFHADCAIRGRWSFDNIEKTEIINNLQEPLMKVNKVPWLGLYCGTELLHLESENTIHAYSSSLSILVRK